MEPRSAPPNSLSSVLTTAWIRTIMLIRAPLLTLAATAGMAVVFAATGMPGLFGPGWTLVIALLVSVACFAGAALLTTVLDVRRGQVWAFVGPRCRAHWTCWLWRPVSTLALASRDLERAHLSNFRSLPQGHGAGTSLAQTVVRWLDQQGLTASLTCTDELVPGYTRYGFRETGRIRGRVFPLRRADLAVMERKAAVTAEPSA